MEFWNILAAFTAQYKHFGHPAYMQGDITGCVN